MPISSLLVTRPVASSFDFSVSLARPARWARSLFARRPGRRRSVVRGDAGVGERHQLGARERDVAGSLPARDDGAGRRVLSTTTTTAGWTSSWSTAAPADFYTPKTPLQERALQEQPRRHVHRRDRQGGRRRAARSSAWAAAIADYDNDGYPGHPRHRRTARCTLYHNNGNGTFTDVTDKAGVAAPGWTTSAVWFDYDNDGKLDLFLCSFVEFSLTNNVFCGDNKLGKRFYCIPRVFKPTPSLLFHNNGDGTFTEVSAGTDIQQRARQGARRRRHGHQRRRADGSVRRERHGAELPLREPRQGQVGRDRAGGRSRLQRQRARRDRAWAWTPRTSTATAGRISSSPTSTRRCSRSTGTTGTSSSPTSPRANGVAQATRLLSGWGLKFFDYDNDGFVDLFLANGHPDDMIEKYSQQVRYKEPLLLFHNDGTKLANVSDAGGTGLQEDVSRARPRGRRLQQRRPRSTC